MITVQIYTQFFLALPAWQALLGAGSLLLSLSGHLLLRGAWTPFVTPGLMMGLFCVCLCLCVLVFFPQFTGQEHEGCTEGWGVNFVCMFNTLAQHRYPEPCVVLREQSLVPCSRCLVKVSPVIPAIPAAVPEPVSWHWQPHAAACALIWPWNLLFHCRQRSKLRT